MIYKYRRIYFTGNEVGKLYKFFNENVVRHEFLYSFPRYVFTCSDIHCVEKYPGRYPQFLIDFVYKIGE